MLSSIAILVLLRTDQRRVPVVLWANPSTHEFLDVRGVKYTGQFLDELKHPNGVVRSLYQKWSLLTCLSLPYEAEQPSFAIGPREHPTTAGIAGVWWEPGFHRVRDGFARNPGSRLWFGAVPVPTKAGPLELGTATGKWKTVSEWKINGETTGPKFVLAERSKVTKQVPGPHAQPGDVTPVPPWPNESSVVIEATDPTSWPSLNVRIQAYDPSGHRLLPGGSMPKNGHREYWFSLETEGISHRTKLGSIRIETRPYTWRKVNLGPPP